MIFSAQITDHYLPKDLIGKQIQAVVNFPPKQIGPFMSEVLTLGVKDYKGRLILVEPDKVVMKRESSAVLSDSKLH